MDKITEVNVEGDRYQFVAGNAVKAGCAATADDWVKTVTLPEGAVLTDGLTVSVLFLNGNTAGFTGSIDVYSDDGVHFYYDDQLTDPVTLPPAICYTMTFIEGQRYSFSAYPVISVNSASYPVCDSRGKPCGGPIWSAGDTISFLFLDNKFLALTTTVINEVTAASSLPVASNAVNDFANTLVASVLNSTFHVGYIYMSVDPTDPSTFLPGTWERLPDGVFVRNAGGNAGTVGQTQAEGLPNITGTANMQGSDSNGGCSGAFAVVNRGVHGSGTSQASNYIRNINFYASRSSSIYGKSSHVTPYNYAVYMWRRTA